MTVMAPNPCALHIVALVLLGLTAGCEALPRDPAGTSKRIAAERSFSVGFVDPSARDTRETQALLREIERRSGARAKLVSGDGERMLSRLDTGTVDLALGRFAEDSPMQAVVAFGPPLAVSRQAGRPIELKAAMRNGENRWIVTVERASRAISAQARAQ